MKAIDITQKKEHRTKLLGKDDRYAVLGPSMVIIYKNEEMTDIRNVLPIFPFLMRVIFVEKIKILIYKLKINSINKNNIKEQNDNDNIFNNDIKYENEIFEPFEELNKLKKECEKLKNENEKLIRETEEKLKLDENNGENKIIVDENNNNEKLIILLKEKSCID